MSADETQAYASEPAVEILENTAEVQAVRQKEKGLTGIMFWKDQPASAGGISSDKKAAVLVQETGEELRVSVSDPTQLNTGSIEIEIDTSVQGISFTDGRVTVEQLAPTVRLSVDVNGATGESFSAVFTKNTLPETTTLLELGRNITQSAANEGTVFHEKGSMLYRRWATDADQLSIASSGTAGDRLSITHYNTLWFSNHISLSNGSAVTNEKPVVLELTYRVSAEDPAQADQVQASLRLWNRGTGPGIDMEYDVPFSPDDGRQTATFVLDPKKRTMPVYQRQCCPDKRMVAGEYANFRFVSLSGVKTFGRLAANG